MKFVPDLHRASKHADWDAVAPERRSWLQHTAAKTGGTVTPGNIISVLGAALVGIGLYEVRQGGVDWGIAHIAAGRMADVLDGIVAARTRTKSPLGEALDATLDKAVLFAVLIIFIVSSILPAVPAACMVSLQAATALISLVAKQRKQILHPSRTGKLATAVLWVGLLLYGTESLTGWPWMLWAAHLTTAAALAGGVLAAIAYARTAFRPTVS